MFKVKTLKRHKLERIYSTGLANPAKID